MAIMVFMDFKALMDLNSRSQLRDINFNLVICFIFVFFFLNLCFSD
ncbi:Uncharacterised protein [Tatumella ptyseos]|uniref:Uncharacterized protein n=1 Tax=Tatumella ptyseos TaxID=82987 RepID=A0A2X5RF80_9GAMM|nr:Uncharacterised protein [Tatumella ptyseos]